MNIKIALKSIIQTRGIDYLEYKIEDNILTLEDLIINLVDIEIDRYESQKEEILSQDDIDRMIISGKVSFGFKYRKDSIDRDNAKEVALLAFKDSLYTVFLNDIEIKSLSEILNLKSGDLVTLIRFTMLTGRFY